MMTMLKELAAELVGMFVGEMRLTISLLAIVAIAAILVDVIGVAPLLGGATLLLGCVVLLVESVLRGARPRRS
jgi:hypothetical protein